MAEVLLSAVLELLERANQQGIVISLREDELIIKFSRSKEIDPLLLANLKQHKTRLKEYLSGQLKPRGSEMEAGYIIQEGIRYYELAPVQRWWVDETRDTILKKNQNGLFCFKITGAGFSPAVLQQTVLHIAQRHESLRSAFRKIGDKNYLWILPAEETLFKIEYNDLRTMPDTVRSEMLEEIMSRQIDFDLNTGPLFATKLYQTGETEYYFSIHMHHVVYDSWSFDVLRHDLFTAYLFYSGGRTPVLPPMKFQYKEYMSLMNRHIKKNGEAHKAYWENRFPHLPEDLVIPGVKPGMIGSEKHCYDARKLSAFLSREVIEQLHLIASKHQTGLFVVIQVLFKLYLRKITGQEDIVIGLQGFGRDILMDAEDQIGVYATTSVIRTIFSGEESLAATIEKVKLSNADMHTYSATTLLETMQSKVPPPDNRIGRFTKVLLDYLDSNGFFTRNENTTSDTPQVADMDIVPLSELPKKFVINTDMKCFFMYINNQMDFKIIYNADMYEEPVITSFVDGLRNFMQTTVENFSA
ncbi:MAG: hypothetical protein J7623_15105 [Chitinophaga sp.]|uniref:condensation domain-containing protein n=1 Tax=Chitinophaga sp. TaxID=1869181 RepID=UPI001B29FBF2|nr:condensation domain-containing protein [Chitinophaga sp.]MBO9729963.1 hypothetical protein [Chitinophaga sp.]